MSAYYNEIDPFAAAWLRELIKAGRIASGDVDERSIEDVTPDDLRSYTQVHLFAGIGVWSHALRCAGWPDDRPVWTGSCPCQPFSAAGQGGGFADERHLWPAFHHLIRERRPPVVLGEQVASKDGLAWLDLVSTDMEATGYAGGAIDLCAAGVGAPHIRQRQWLAWVADTEHAFGRAFDLDRENGRDRQDDGRKEAHGEPGARGKVCGLANADGRDASAERQQPGGEQRQQQADGGTGFGMADAFGQGRQGRDARPMGFECTSLERDRCGEPSPQPATGPTDSFWRDADWLFCRDGKWRPVEPGTFPLAHGAPARVGRLRGYGNAINAEAARVFIEAVLETIDWKEIPALDGQQAFG